MRGYPSGTRFVLLLFLSSVSSVAATSCGGTLTKSQGTIKSPNYPSEYSSNLDCTWTIKGSSHQLVTLQFGSDFAIEAPNKQRVCKYDFLEIYDADVSKAGTWCGTDRPPDFTSMTSEVKIRFKSDDSDAAKGFTFKWNVVDKPADVILYNENGTIDSSGSVSSWEIRVNPRNFISLQFNSITPGSVRMCSDDKNKIEVFDVLGNSTLIPLMTLTSGSQLPRPIRSLGSRMVIRLHVVFGCSKDELGFTASWSSDDDCNKNLTGVYGTLFTSNYPLRYQTDQHCNWTIKTDAFRNIKLSFDPLFELESRNSKYDCAYDRLEAFDILPNGSRHSMGMWCGTSGPSVLQPTGSSVELEFHSDGSSPYTGFLVHWEKTDDFCNRILNGTSGNISSLDFPSQYPTNLDCRWEIHASLGEFVFLNFFEDAFGLEETDQHTCAGDVIQVFDQLANKTLIPMGKWCGTKPPRALKSSGPGLVITFTTDSVQSNINSTSKGFLANWSTTNLCVNTLTGESGFLHSPNYPLPTNQTESCSWKIHVDRGYTIELTFDPSVHPQMNDCDNNNLTIYDDNKDFLGTWCGNETTPMVFQSKTNNLVLIHSYRFEHSYRSFNGFFATWTRQIPTCNKVFSSESGSFSSLNYPSPYLNGLDCQVEIKVPEGQFIRLEFASKFGVGEKIKNGNCSDDFIEPFDIAGDNSLISWGRQCGNFPPSPIQSFGSRVLVIFHTDNNADNNGAGFQFSWTTLKECGRNFTTNQGVIRSYAYQEKTPFGIKSLSPDYSCLWGIQLAWGFHASLTFTTPINCSQLTISDVFPEDGSVIPIDNWCVDGAANQHVSSTSHWVQIHYQPEVKPSHDFLASWKSVCGDTYHTKTGRIGQPINQTFYENSLDCEWTIVAPEDHVIHLDFDSQFDIEYSTNCDYDYIEILETLGGRLESRGRYCGGNRPLLAHTAFYSPAVIRFHTDQDKSGTGFSVSWNTQHLCKDIITQDNGIINFPTNTNSRLPDVRKCHWEINVSPWLHQIQVTFNGTFNYNDTILKVSPQSYPNDVHTLNTSQTITLHASTLLVDFISEHSVDEKGFSLAWEAACKEVLTGPSGNLTSPDYADHAGSYPPSLNCEWEIRAPQDHAVSLWFDGDSGFELESSPDGLCSFDSVQVFSVLPNGTAEPIRTKLCGNRAPLEELHSTSSTMLVKFLSDADKGGKGFRAFWSSSCGRKYRANHGELTSPGYPSNYPNNNDCRWDIEVDEGLQVKLSFDDETQFGIEKDDHCDVDYVEIFDVSHNGSETSLGKQCGHQVPLDLKSTSNKMTVTFHSDDSKNDVGFKASWKAVCGEVLTGEEGHFSYPNKRSGSSLYPNNFDCEWRIEGLDHQDIHLHFDSDFQLEAAKDGNCIFDYVEVLEVLPNEALLSRGKFCGNTAPGPFVAISSTVIIRFHSDEDKADHGFALSWSSACKQTFTSNTGELKTPGYPVQYPNNLNCSWEIRVDPGYSVSLAFVKEFGLNSLNRECTVDADYVELFDKMDNSTLTSLGRFCGSMRPQTQRSKSNTMLVDFKSDASRTSTGFMAYWTAVCGDTIRQDQGSLSSPLFPANYPNNLNCSWEIFVAEGWRVQLRFDPKSSLERNPDHCKYDDVEIKDHFSNGTAIEAIRWCSIRQPPMWVSSGNHVTLTFHSDESKTDRGFNVSWDKVKTCGGNFTTASGYLMSPNYPNKYPSKTECKWSIEPPGHVNITLSFNANNFQLEQSDDCTSDYIQISRGGEEILGKHCGNSSPPDLSSNGQRLEVIFRSDKSTNFEGFFASWN